jgi:hypothetical protein
MKRLSEATPDDFDLLLGRVQGLPEFTCAEEAAQAVVGLLYEFFRESLALLRLFVTVPYGELPAATRQFVDRRGTDTGTSHLIHDRTPVFTLLGTRGEHAEWNERHKSQRFRCIPLASSAFVASLPMLSRQFKSVGFDLALIDDWNAAVVGRGRADAYTGMLYIRNAATDRDEQGRMIVPVQDFVVTHGIRTVLGFGSGYANHPTMVTLFAFTREDTQKANVEPLATLLEAYVARSSELVGRGRIFLRERHGALLKSHPISRAH